MLGILWNVEKDVFQFEVFKPDKPATKQGILAAISSLYDRMSFVCPVVLEAKKIMQQLWKLQLAWDDPVPECELSGASNHGKRGQLDSFFLGSVAIGLD